MRLSGMGEGLNQDSIPDSSIGEATDAAGLEADWQTTQLEFAWVSTELEPEQPAAYSSLDLAAIKQNSAQEIDQNLRIQQMEQALDQCQVYINELKLQLADQQFLEEVLAKTEEASHIQQQAINSLRQQLGQQEGLEQQVAELNQSKSEIQAALTAMAAQSQTDQAQLQEIKTQLAQQQAEAETTRGSLEQKIVALQTRLDTKETESQALQISALQRTDQVARLKTQMTQLEADVSDRQHQINTLESRVQRTKEVIAAQQDIISALQQNQGTDSSKNKVIQSMSKTLLNAQNKMESLEAEFSSQRLLHAQLQHYSQELEGKTGEYQKRASQLEKQVAEMQEQILHQAQQSSEYEAAIQHWKDRCLTAEQSVLQLKTVMEQLLTDRNLTDLLSADSIVDAAAIKAADSDQLEKGIKFDLPAFLYLRRNSKV
jgi:chromosome segregation ATPase